MSFNQAGITRLSQLTTDGPWCWEYSTSDPLADVVDNYFNTMLYVRPGDIMAITASDGKKLVGLYGANYMTKIANGVTSFLG